ncbi:hypothetical protein RDWZM_006201 [Blomia tropicalis]|uniref:DNA topoisomerase I n=1 Tax=Blomia tropicalis TaxID=40697 RepID=A0A9Q0RN32_BLOTA|nr:hypothetical protein RDWZM_006201 [Blomia tropicalis]
MAYSSSAEESDQGSDYNDTMAEHSTNGSNGNGSSKHRIKSDDSDDDDFVSSTSNKNGMTNNHTSSRGYNHSYKEESDEDDYGVKKEDASDYEEDNYVPKEKKSKKSKKDKSEKKSKKRKKADSDESDDESNYKSSKSKSKKKKKKSYSDDDDEEDFDDDADYAKKKKHKKEKTKDDKKSKSKSKDKSSSKDAKGSESPTKGTKRKKKEEEEEHIWKWWEEERPGEGIKWKTLEHNGPVFPPAYDPLPNNVKFYYDGKSFRLSPEAEEVAGFYARMLEHDYTSKDIFNKNFFKDWRKTMTEEEREKISDLKLCNFSDMAEFYKEQSEKRKQLTKEEKLENKKKNEETVLKYGYCTVDGHKQKIGNFRIEPPGLFRGRGEHPKMGKLKKRVRPEDIIINIGDKAKVPAPPSGHKWKEIRHDNTVTWLASWTENIMGNIGKSMRKARELKKYVGQIRKDYREDFKSREMMRRQRAVALYFIDRLALRAGNEKEEGETADTVGCCSLRVEHIELHEEKDGKQYVVDFDFLGKDSIRYSNSVPVEKRVFKNLKHFIQGKSAGDDLFDRLNTSSLNKYLNSLMDGLTAKVFRTYNASQTLQQQLNELTKDGMSQSELLLAYNRANRAVAVLCNHQRAVPKTFDKQMENLNEKIKDKKATMKDVKKQYKEAKGDETARQKLKKKLSTLEDQLKKLEVQKVDKEENKQIALGTSKLNYLDPRISVAWCKKWEFPVDKIYNKTQRDKFRWAIEMVGPDYQF